MFQVKRLTRRNGEKAVLAGMDERMQPAMKIAGELWEKYGAKFLGVSCGVDGDHSAASLHYCGRAVDLDISWLDNASALRLYNELRAKLKPLGFDLLKHSVHVHIEYDPK